MQPEDIKSDQYEISYYSLPNLKTAVCKHEVRCRTEREKKWLATKKHDNQ